MNGGVGLSNEFFVLWVLGGTLNGLKISRKKFRKLSVRYKKRIIIKHINRGIWKDYKEIKKVNPSFFY